MHLPSGSDRSLLGRLDVSSLPSSAWAFLLQRPGQWKNPQYNYLIEVQDFFR